MTTRVLDRRAERHAAVRDEVVTASWMLAGEHGLTGFGLRDVAAAIGMRAPSLYSYFPSKNAIYDAMFVEGNQVFLARIRSLQRSRSPRVTLIRAIDNFLDFCREAPARQQLLFQRVIPGFEPSAAAYASAVACLDAARELLADLGRPEPWHLDLWTAITAGLAAQQAANDPDGRRWADLAPPAVDMFLTYTEKGRR